MTFHEKIFTELIKYKETHPEFRFISRQINRNGRLEDGYWFQGNDDYAFVGLVDRSGGSNMTRSVGLVFWPVEDYLEFSIEIVHKGEKDDYILSLYDKLKEILKDFIQKDSEKHYKYLGDTSNGFNEVFKFLDENYLKIIDVFKKSSRSDLIIDEIKFNQLISKINSYRKNSNDIINKLLINITWNSKDWKDVSEDKSNHRWVKEGGTPGESLNFAKDADGNTDEHIFGYAKFTHQPKIKGTSIFIFYSQGKIVGFYGNAEIIHKELDENLILNLKGDQELSFVLENKIDNAKELGFLEDKDRVGMINFNYLEEDKTVISILEKALELNPNQKNEINKLKDWFIKVTHSTVVNSKKYIMNNEVNLNQILFGPPGTGKTFNTINEALKIVDPVYFATHKNDRKKLTDRFKELLIKNSEEKKGQIGFCTFHQSFSYEDFVEGIKPKTTENKGVYYDVEPGVFKRICQLADSYNSTMKVKTEGKISWTEEQFRKASFYKLSLGNYQDPSDRAIYEYCRDNKYIAIGFGQENDFSGLSESEIIEKCEELKLEVTAAQQMNYFIHYLKRNNYVIISNGNKYVRAIGKVIGDYEYVAESPIRYNHFRKVEWLFVDELIPIEEIYERGLSQKTMYKIDESLLKRDFFTNNGQETLVEVKDKEKKYVLVIDEINRGNVSSIFGELITLIEKDKRAGCDEELEVTLPYSKEPFKVPNNVYIIGTMNTADKSIEALDTALRRRFSFKEFSPKPYLIKTEGASSKNGGKIDGIDLENLLNTINTRIEKLIDKDHKIGHSYFLKVDNKEKLVYAFKNEIIPLLEEYFFGDYGKIGLVLGASFVEKVNYNFDFAKFEHYDTDIQSDLKEKAIFRIKQEDQWDFSTI